MENVAEKNKSDAVSTPGSLLIKRFATKPEDAQCDADERNATQQ